MVKNREEKDSTSYSHCYIYSKTRSSDLHEFGKINSDTKRSKRSAQSSKPLLEGLHDLPLDQAKRIFVFVHGLWSDTKDFFSSSTFYLEQNLYPNISDLDVVISYQWKGKLRYKTNQAITQEKGFHFYQLLKHLRAKTDSGTRIDIMAHSMGTQVFAKAVELAEEESFNLGFHQVLLMASDISTDVFDHKLASLNEQCHRIHVYFNNTDNTLKAANLLCAHPRLGKYGISGAIPAYVTQYDYSSTISDYQSRPGKFNHHRYYYDSPTACKDILTILNRN